MAETDLPINDLGTHVHVHNAETGGYWDCPISYLPIARQRGWEPAERIDEGQPINAIADAQPVEPVLFDPSAPGVTAEDVSAHLAAHAEADPGEVERVLGLERAGKNRKTITVPEGFEPVTGD
jgi:hypothetical protein